jgi:hypothetical protein
MARTPAHFWGSRELPSIPTGNRFERLFDFGKVNYITSVLAC